MLMILLSWMDVRFDSLNLGVGIFRYDEVEFEC